MLLGLPSHSNLVLWEVPPRICCGSYLNGWRAALRFLVNFGRRCCNLEWIVIAVPSLSSILIRFSYMWRANNRLVGTPTRNVIVKLGPWGLPTALNASCSYLWEHANALRWVGLANGVRHLVSPVILSRWLGWTNLLVCNWVLMVVLLLVSTLVTSWLKALGSLFGAIRMDLKLSMLSWFRVSWKPLGRGLARRRFMWAGSARKKCRQSLLVWPWLAASLDMVSLVKLAFGSYREITIWWAVISICGMTILGLL